MNVIHSQFTPMHLLVMADSFWMKLEPICNSNLVRAGRKGRKIG